jgi:hypothetical protein
MKVATTAFPNISLRPERFLSLHHAMRHMATVIVEPGTLLRVSWRALLAALTLFALLFVSVLFEARPAVAQESSVVALAQTGGREVGLRDWINHLPLALGAAFLVITVDAFVIIRFVRGRKERR